MCILCFRSKIYDISKYQRGDATDLAISIPPKARGENFSFSAVERGRSVANGKNIFGRFRGGANGSDWANVHPTPLTDVRRLWAVYLWPRLYFGDLRWPGARPPDRPDPVYSAVWNSETTNPSHFVCILCFRSKIYDISKYQRGDAILVT